MAGFCPIILEIVKGVPAAPGDPNTAEQPLETLNLLDGANTIGLQTDGWAPNFPALKGGGLWANSAVSDSQTPLSNAVDKVTETMTLIMGNTVLAQRNMVLKKLAQLIKSIRDFWATEWQIQPVYLKMQAAGAPGPQYCLIYNLELAERGDPFNTLNAWEFTITIDRYPYWRPIPPGSAAKEWTLAFQGKIRGTQDFNYDDLNLVTGTNHLVYDEIQNREELDIANYVTKLVKSYITVPAASIPGDAPALVSLSFEPGFTQDAMRLFIARDTKPLTAIKRDGTTRARAYFLNVGDAEVASLTKTLSASLGNVSNGSNSNAYYGLNGTLGAAATATAKWGVLSATNFYRPDMQLFRGRLAFFARVLATGGADDDVKAKLIISENYLNVTDFQQEGTEVGIRNGAGGSSWELVYLGTFNIPFNTNAQVDVDGRGLFISPNTADANLYLELQLRNSSAGNRNVQALDIVALPVDECFAEMNLFVDVKYIFVMDNTGYLSHGKPEAVGKAYYGTQGWTFSLEYKGDDLTLVPNQDNRLVFLYNIFVTTEEISANHPVGEAPMKVRLDIVPQWIGIRDV